MTVELDEAVAELRAAAEHIVRWASSVAVDWCTEPSATPVVRELCEQVQVALQLARCHVVLASLQPVGVAAYPAPHAAVQCVGRTGLGDEPARRAVVLT